MEWSEAASSPPPSLLPAGNPPSCNLESPPSPLLLAQARHVTGAFDTI